MELKKRVEKITRKVQSVLIKEGFDKPYLKDIRTVICDRINQDYTDSHKTRLYKSQGGSYCRTLELIEEYFTE